jgi:hypothetical protein
MITAFQAAGAIIVWRSLSPRAFAAAQADAERQAQADADLSTEAQGS